MTLNLEGQSSLRDWSTLAKELNENQYREINLANQIGFGLYGYLVEPILTRHLHLHTLILRGTNFRDMAALSRGLEKHCSLKVLDLSQNPLHDEGVIFLTSALKTHVSLESLALNQCHLTSKSGHALVEALKTNCVMKRLSCADNHFDESVACAFKSLLNVNTTLMELNLQGNSFPATHLSDLHAILTSRQGKIERQLQAYLATLPLQTREHTYVELESLAYNRLRAVETRSLTSQKVRNILYLQKMSGRIFAGSICIALLNSFFFGRHVTQLSSITGLGYLTMHCACIALALVAWDFVRFTKKDYDLSFMGMVAFSWEVVMHEESLSQDHSFVTAKLASLLRKGKL